MPMIFTGGFSIWPFMAGYGAGPSAFRARILLDHVQALDHPAEGREALVVARRAGMGVEIGHGGWRR
jgi:hypothetical protein